MAIYLDEDCLGGPDDEINYPHLLLCMSLTIQMRDGKLFGVHITSSTVEKLLLAKLRNFSQGSPRRIYVIGDQGVHQNKAKGKAPLLKAKELQYYSEFDVVTYDTSQLNGKQGYFVRLVSPGGEQECTVYAAKDEDIRPYPVSRDSRDTAKVKKYSTFNQGWVAPQTVSVGTGKPLPPPLKTSDLIKVQ
jgi:hypothetical protein